MDPLVIGVLAVVAILALLVARGMWLLGRGSEAEQAAREKTGGSAVASSGWTMLDGLQHGEVPIVSDIEERLGINQDEEDEDR